MHALDRRDLRHAARRKPVEEFDSRARIGVARVRIPDLRREEFKEAIGSALASGGDDGVGAIGEDGDELVHFPDFFSNAFSSFFRSCSNFSMSSGVDSATSWRPLVVGCSETTFNRSWPR